MKNRKASNQLLPPHRAILLLLVAGIMIHLVSLWNIGKQVDALYSKSYIVKNAAATMDAAFEAIQKSVFRSISNNSPDVIEQEITDAKKNTVIIQEQMAIVRQNSLGDMDVVSRLEKNLSILETMQEQAFHLIGQNRGAEAADYIENNNIPVITKAQKDLALLIQMADTKENEIITSLQKTQRTTIILLFSPSIAIVLFSIKVGIFIRQLQT